MTIQGHVICGFPSPSEENREESLDFNSLLIKHKSTTFCLRAYGTSMSPVIMPGDILLVDRSLGTRNGDIVVAEYNGDFTVKFLIKKGQTCLLRAENKSFEDIEINENIHIFGVVTSIVRCFRWNT